MILVDVTGEHPLVPVCPKHRKVALVPEKRPKSFPMEGKANEVGGFWRCPIDNRIYIFDTISPK